jgi:O-antigen ligase
MTIARDFPLVGSGIDTFATAIVAYETPDRPTLFTEAHNEYLQLASEGGLLVCVPAVGALAVFIVAVWRRFSQPAASQMTWWIRVGAVAGLIAIALQSSVEFSLRIPANAVLCSVLCAIALHREAAAPAPGLAASPGRREATRA